MVASWEQYNKKASCFFESYMSLSFIDIFSDVNRFFPRAGSTCLDIGSGSGRDSAELAKRGLKVTAVEPSDGLRKLAMSYHQKLPIKWIKDYLPELSKVKKLSIQYDFILMSAVWMHLSPEDRQKALNTSSILLKSGGVMVLTLRLGPAEPERTIYEISTNEAIEKAERAGLKVRFVNPIKNDGLKRGNVQWQILVLYKL